MKTAPQTHRSSRNTTPKYLVPVLSPFRKVVYAILIGIWLATLCNLWTWWLQQEHVTSLFGFFLTSVMLLWVTALPGYFFFFAYRAKRPNPNLHVNVRDADAVLPQSAGTESENRSVQYPITPYHQNIPFAAVVAHAPSEDARIAIRTLEALVAIRNQHYPKMAIFLATEDNGKQLGQERLIGQFCSRNRITISCRYGLSSYQRDSFPRRKKSKEGNLAYFYDAYFFSNTRNTFRFCLQFDVDHVPTAGYVSAVLHAFDDPEVGYVSAPSICDANSHASWWVKPRVIVEATLHGILQAGYNGNWAPMPIGSHYAVRIEALRNLVHPIRKSFWSRQYEFHTGGLGPELAEDHTTGLANQANGWKGVHAIDAIAYGDGPESFMDAMVQEQQWSRSLMQVLLKWTNGYFKLGRMSLHLKLEYLFAQAWYPLFAVFMLVGTLLPLVALWTQTSWVNVNYLGFLAHSIPTTIACLLPIFWLRISGVLRPNNVPLINLQTILFQLARWPWALLGILEGFVGSVILNRELSFRVTPKGTKGARTLSLKAILPYLLIVLADIATSLLVDRPGEARGYHYFVLLTGLLYLLMLVAVIVTHLMENRKREGYSARIVWKPMFAAAALCVLFTVAVINRGPEALASITGWRIHRPTTPLVSPEQISVPDDTSIANRSTDVPPAQPWEIINIGQEGGE